MTNVERLQKVAEGLDELNEKVVYVGGSLPGLYATDPAAPEPRATMDVDCIVDYGNQAERELFEKWLRLKKFSEDQEDDVICRWKYDGEPVDIIPTEERFYGFTNRWYKRGMQSKENVILPNGRAISILSIVTFVATKFEALLSRGSCDYRGEKDFEDIVYILDCCPEFAEQLKDERDADLKTFVIERLSELLIRPNIHEEIECVLPIGDEGRGDEVLKAIESCIES